MYSMKEACLKTGLPYETLKYYCNEGLVPNVKRDSHNYRVFDFRDIAWIKSLACLKKCGMGISEMQQYAALCLLGQASIPERKEILNQKKASLLEKMQEIQDCLDYIESKQKFYDGVLAGSIPYTSNLIPVEKAPGTQQQMPSFCKQKGEAHGQ